MRVQFATDLLNLTLAAPIVNRCNIGGKCGYDAGEWMPEKNRCWFANRVLQIKTKFRLSVDRNEAEALERTLSTCSSFEMIFYSQSEGSNQVGDEKTSPLQLYDDNSNGRISCSEAKRHNIAPVFRQHPAYKFMRDADGDGIVCGN